MTMTKPAKPAKRNQGMNWCRPSTRLALYLRDGMCCVYCGAKAEDGAKLTLDHMTPYTLGGSNKADNLVTACVSCNSARGKKSVTEFAGWLAAREGVEKEAILRHVRNCSRRVLPRKEARALLKARGTVRAAVHGE